MHLHLNNLSIFVSAELPALSKFADQCGDFDVTKLFSAGYLFYAWNGSLLLLYGFKSSPPEMFYFKKGMK